MLSFRVGSEENNFVNVEENCDKDQEKLEKKSKDKRKKDKREKKHKKEKRDKNDKSKQKKRQKSTSKTLEEEGVRVTENNSSSNNNNNNNKSIDKSDDEHLDNVSEVEMERDAASYDEHGFDNDDNEANQDYSVQNEDDLESEHINNNNDVDNENDDQAVHATLIIRVKKDYYEKLRRVFNGNATRFYKSSPLALICPTL